MAEHDLQTVAFPTLDEAQVATLGSCAGTSLTKYRAGQALFRCGDRDAKFFIIKSGQVEIRDETGDAPRRCDADLAQAPCGRKKTLFSGSHRGCRAGSRQSLLSDLEAPSYHT